MNGTNVTVDVSGNWTTSITPAGQGALVVAAVPASAGTSRIYITNSAGDAINVIDPETNTVVQNIKGIEAARDAFLTTDLPQKMARYHQDAEATFWGWNHIWLSSDFRDWNIESFLPGAQPRGPPCVAS